MRLRRQNASPMLMWILVSLYLAISYMDPIKTALAIPLDDDDYDEYVQEVLNENSWHHDEDNPYFEDPPPTMESDEQGEDQSQGDDYFEERLRRKREEERLKQLAEAERAQRQAAEEAFARELSSLSPEEQKLLRQKRRRDSRIVQRILNAWQRNDYYAVLGLRWFFPEGITLIPGRGGGSKKGKASKNDNKPQKFNLKQAVLKQQWPDLIILRMPTRTIQQAYRSRAVQVHPDKNKDHRTDQAFVAVQDAHAVLSDPNLRKEYEEERRQHRVAIRQAWMDRYHKLMQTTLKPFWVVFRKIFGPLTVPIVVIGGLIF